jgi:HlyD family secretion protein
MAQPNGKKSKRRIIIFSILGTILLALVLLVILGSNREKIVTVQTEKVQRRDITQIVTASGKIQPEVQVKINAEVSGEIIDLPVKEGQRVRKGQLLVRIKPDAYQAQVERAEAVLVMQRANLTKAEAEFKRISELFQKNLVSQAEMDLARASYQSAKAAYDQASASLKEARETLAKTFIYAPMEGVVSQLKSQLGERVSGSTFTQGTEIMTVADLSRMEARVDVGENDVVLVSLGDTARIRVDAYPDRTFLGVVTYIANTAKSRGLGTQEEITNFEVRIRLTNHEGMNFRPGMSMTADIETERHANVLSIPIQSVTVRLPKEEQKKSDEPAEGEARLISGESKKKKDDEVQEVVFVVNDGKVKALPVKRGIADDTYVEIVSGLEEGAEVVSGPFKAINRELEDGTKVKIDNKRTVKTGAVAEAK